MRLQVVIVSPSLLSFVAQREVRLDEVLDMNRTLALLLGTTEQEVMDRQIEGRSHQGKTGLSSARQA